MPDAIITGTSVVPSAGGMAKTMRKFREALDGHVVSFTSTRFSDEERAAFVDVEHVPTSTNRLLEWYGWASPVARRDAERMVEGAKLITCHVMLRYHAHWVRKMAQRENIPYWFVPHGQLDPWVYTYRAGVKKAWAELFGRRLLAEARFVIFATEQERRKAAWFHEGANTRVVHWPVDLTDIEGKEEAASSLREQFGIPTGGRILLYFGRLHSMKKPLETIRMIRKVAADGAHLLVVGPDGDVTAAQCRAEAQKLGLGGYVHVTGPVYGDQKERFLLGSDTFISLSHRENFGHTAAESLAAGTPVILSPGNDLAPELAPLGCGWMLAANEEDAAVEAVRSLLASDAATLARMGERGRSFIAEECAPERFRSTLRLMMAE